MATGLGAFTEGFGSGYSGVQKSRQRRRINKALDLEIAEGTLKRKGKLSRANLLRKRAGEEEFEDYGGDLKPTWGEKLGGWAKSQAGKIGGAVGGALGFGGQQAPADTPPTAAAPVIQPIAGQQPQPTNRFGPGFQSQPPPMLQNGGPVRHMVKKYYGGGSVNRSMQPTPLANGGRGIPANRSTPGRTTGQIPGGGVMFADGGNYSSGLHAVPQPLRNGGAATAPINTRNQSRTAIPMQDGGPLTEDEKALKRAKQLREQRARAGARAEAPAAPKAPMEDVARDQAKRQPAKPAAKPAAETAAKTRTSAISGREVAVKAKKPPTLSRIAAATKAGGAKGLVASGGVGALALPAAMKGAEYLGKTAGALATGQDITDPEIGLTETETYRKLLGMDPVGDENELVRLGGDLLARGLGTMKEIGDAITMGYADDISNWVVNKLSGIDETAAQPAPTAPSPDQPAPDQPAAGPPAGPPNQAATAPAQEDPEIDMAGPEMQGVMPEDMPSHSVEDWEKERYSAAAYAITQGEDPNTAMLAIDQQQQRGFLRYLNQAQRLLVAGDGQSAARSMYAAYSYFPNGTDVRFGITKGANGQPILMGMGTDEKTGEPVNDGKTMAITPETIAVMAENATNPSAWRTWTKDWREMEKQIREIEEIDKPKAEQEIRTGAAREDYLRAGAQEARATAARGGVTALKESDYRGTADALDEMIWNDPDVDPDDVNALSAVGARAKRSYQHLDNKEIGRFILAAYADGLGPDEILDAMDQFFSRQ